MFHQARHQAKRITGEFCLLMEKAYHSCNYKKLEQMVRQNICEVGDLSVKLPCCLYNVQQDAKPAASYSRISHISGATVPVSAYPDQVHRVAQHMGNRSEIIS